ncbi:nickel transport ATP-binding protein NikD [Klebsiella pneumoniae]|uniref:Nickel transport ATP-binding protein NikD n=1 Tax=Klebsiella pneumoniae TaxID=573 RepID=A0A378FU05_KLEPN|nr:nickel transport ATP-binding protein NikD [Klebsiella pneumoniae]
MPQKIQLEQISLAADRPLVSDVSFTLRRGQVLALLGSSGCGKSLTCAAALGLLPPGVRQTAGRGASRRHSGARRTAARGDHRHHHAEPA